MSDSATPGLQAIIELPRYGRGTGLHRVQALAGEVLASSWSREVSPIHVVGTNGKGSVSQLIAQILAELRPSQRVGMYTSPHVLSFGERMRVQGQPIGDSMLERYAEGMVRDVEAYLTAHPGDIVAAFEAITAMALRFFAEQKTEVLVLEAGIGGRYDSTKVLQGRLAALTSLDLEHTQLLGNTLAEIGCDKLDILAPGGTAVLGPISQVALRAMETHAQARQLVLHPFENYVHELSLELNPNGIRFSAQVGGVSFQNIQTSFLAPYQVENALVALRTLQVFAQQSNWQVSNATWQESMARVLSNFQVAGRMQVLNHEPLVLIDSAHTPASFQLLKESMSQLSPGPITLVLGMSEDKALKEQVALLTSIAQRVVLVQPRHRGASVARMESLMPIGAKAFTATSVANGLRMALGMAQEQNGAVLVAGGLFLAAEALESWPQVKQG